MDGIFIPEFFGLFTAQQLQNVMYGRVQTNWEYKFKRISLCEVIREAVLFFAVLLNRFR